LFTASIAVLPQQARLENASCLHEEQCTLFCHQHYEHQRWPLCLTSHDTPPRSPRSICTCRRMESSAAPCHHTVHRFEDSVSWPGSDLRLLRCHARVSCTTSAAHEVSCACALRGCPAQLVLASKGSARLCCKIGAGQGLPCPAHSSFATSAGEEARSSYVGHEASCAFVLHN
jgi:hypothetical protein